MEKKTAVFMICGISGSGKTFFSKKLELSGVPRISMDEELWPDYYVYPGLFSKEHLDFLYEQATERIFAKIRNFCAEGRACSVDMPFCKKEQRDIFRAHVESCGGNKKFKKGETYTLPQVIMTFPKDEFQAVSLFRQKLIEHGKYTSKKPGFSELPSWWKNPFVCTYGDQMLENKVGPYIDENWVTELVDIAEKEWGLQNINLIIDDSWQHYFSFEPKAEESRFPDMRRFIDAMHDRGHHVLLWNTPMFENVGNGFKTRAQKLDMISSWRYADEKDSGFGAYLNDLAPESYAFDYTHDNARQFIKEICEVMFGSGEGQYNADGIKLDFMACLRNPAKTTSYSHTELKYSAIYLIVSEHICTPPGYVYIISQNFPFFNIIYKILIEYFFGLYYNCEEVILCPENSNFQRKVFLTF